MSAVRWYYVCDACGDLVTIEETPIPEGEAWECAECGGHALWEFTHGRAALEHSEHIRTIARSAVRRNTQ